MSLWVECVLAGCILDTHQQLCLDIPPSTNHCVYRGQWCLAYHWDFNCEICAVVTSLVLSMGVLQTQVGMKDPNQVEAISQ